MIAHALHKGRQALTVIIAAATATGLAATSASAPTGGTISGVIWRDIDSDGARDSGEPGIPGVTVARAGTPYRAITDSAGRYTLRVPEGTATISVLTGWLASKCPGDLNSANGRGPDQSFEVVNQFPRRTIDMSEGAALTGYDAGFLPDHGDPSGAPGSTINGNDDGDGTAATVDVAVRHSPAENGFHACTDPYGTRVCSPGDEFMTNAQLYNQGTSAIASLRFLVSEPPGARLTEPPRNNLATPTPTAEPTGRTWPTADGGHSVEYRLDAALPAARAVWFTLHWEIFAGPPSPTPYGTGRDRDRTSFIAVTELPDTDRDSTESTTPFADLDAGHNLNWPKAVDKDSSDSVNWNTNAA